MARSLFLALLVVLAQAAAPARSFRSCAQQGTNVMCRITFVDDNEVSASQPQLKAIIGFDLTGFVPPRSFLCALNETEADAIRALPAVESVQVIGKADIGGIVQGEGDDIVKITVMMGQNRDMNLTRSANNFVRELGVRRDSVQIVAKDRVLVEVPSRVAQSASAVLADQCEVLYVERMQAATIINSPA